MNCKPNDLARIVGLVDGEEGANGHLCTVKEPCECEPSTDWACEALGDIPFRDEHVCRGQEFCIRDANLRPIADPGEDAKDEMLRPLPEKKVVPIAPVPFPFPYRPKPQKEHT